MPVLEYPCAAGLFLGNTASFYVLKLPQYLGHSVRTQVRSFLVCLFFHVTGASAAASGFWMQQLKVGFGSGQMIDG